MKTASAIMAALVLATALLTGGVNAGTGFEYDDYAAVLAEYVDEKGLVDYSALKANRARVDAFADALARLDAALYRSWDDGDRIAFWINAYNGLTLKLIVDHYPIESSLLRSIVFPKNSIMQIPGRWKKVTFEVMGEPMTLDAIEHKVLRAQFDEPRIHMALVCAALSCPELRNEPFVAARLEEQLDDQTREFLANNNKFRIDREKVVVYLSAIFDWFTGDFVDRYGTGDPAGKRSEETQAVINFVGRYVSDADAAYLASGDYKIKHLDYDWTLNEQPDSSLSS
jgi:hypothetical protein